MTLADLIAQTVAKAVQKVIVGSADELTRIAQAGGEKAKPDPVQTGPGPLKFLLDLLGEIPVIGSLLEGGGGILAKVVEGGGSFARGLGFGWLIGSMSVELARPLANEPIHAMWAEFPTELLDPGTAAQLAAKGIITPDQAISEAGGSGIDSDREEQLMESAKLWPLLTQTIDLYRRRLISPDEARKHLERNKFPPELWDSILALADVLLSPAELALAELRQNMPHDTAVTEAELQGLSAERYQILLENTGEPPSYTELALAWRREFIDKATFAHGLRQSRIRDEWIPMLEKVHLHPMSEAEAINAAIQGHISKDEAQTKTFQNGLEPGDFEALYETAGEPMARGEMLDLLNRGIMTEAQVIQGIKESHVKDKYIPFILDYRRRLFPLYYLKSIITSGVQGKEWATKYLESLGYTPDDAAAYVDSATSAKVAKAKALTETMVLDLYEARAIEKSEALKMLATAGYDSTEAGFLLQAQDAKAAISEQNKAISAVRTAFLAGRLSLNEASGELDQVGVLATHRDQLLKDWQVERQGIVKVITPTEVADAVKYGLWTWDQAGRKLVAMGYSPEDAIIFLGVHLHGVPPGVSVPPPSNVAPPVPSQYGVPSGIITSGH